HAIVACPITAGPPTAGSRWLAPTWWSRTAWPRRWPPRWRPRSPRWPSGTRSCPDPPTGWTRRRPRRRCGSTPSAGAWTPAPPASWPPRPPAGTRSACGHPALDHHSAHEHDEQDPADHDHDQQRAQHPGRNLVVTASVPLDLLADLATAPHQPRLA